MYWPAVAVRRIEVTPSAWATWLLMKAVTFCPAWAMTTVASASWAAG